MDEVFKALADPSRRALLDALFAEDGQTLSALMARLPMTRFGVMKHLSVLETAGLVVARKRGREKLHFLNAIPIRLIHDRWVSKYAEAWAKALVEMKDELERKMEKVFEIYIKTSPERLWQAITDTEMRKKWNFGVAVTSSFKQGASFKGVAGPNGDMTIIEGEILEVDPPNKLVQTYRACWSDAAKAEGTSRVTWEITQIADSCRLIVVHDQLRDGANPQLYGGWPMVLSGIKTLLETGELLTTPASLQYGPPQQRKAS